MKSINLTKALRAHIVSELVLKATKAERDEIQKEIYRISQDYWKSWDDKWLKESTLTTKQLGMMLAKGMLSRVTEGDIRVEVKAEIYDLREDLKLFLPSSYVGHKRAFITLKSEATHPSFYFTQFECPEGLLNTAKKILERAIASAEQVKDLRHGLEDLAASCRTSKQLLEVLPQAKEFLPVGSSINGLISTKLIEDVQAKLKTGVPV